MIWNRVLALVCLSGGLAACAGLPGTQPSGSAAPGVPAIAERPMSEQPAASEYRRTARIHVDLGNEYLKEAQYGTALDEARHAIAYDKAYAPAHSLMGKVYASLEQFGPAQAAFAESERLAPGDPEVATDYGWFLCSRDRIADGVARLERAVRNPYFRNPVRAWRAMGLCHLRAKNDREAEQALLRAYQLDTQSLQVIYHLAEISFRSGAFVRARELANEFAGKLSPDTTPGSLWLLLRIERKLGNRAAEQKLADQLAREFPASYEYQSYMQGKFE